MTNQNGWPGKPGVPLNPERDGMHWLHCPDDKQPTIALWDAEYAAWFIDGMYRTEVVVDILYRYLGPCLTPAEVEVREDSAQWRAFDEVLCWINTQLEKMISKGALYEAVMEMRPQRCVHTVDAKPKVARNAAMEEVARLRAARVSRLKGLVKEAYEEGFSDGCEEGQELGEFVGNGGDAERHKGRSFESYWKNSYTHTKLGDTQ